MLVALLKRMPYSLTGGKKVPFFRDYEDKKDLRSNLIEIRFGSEGFMKCLNSYSGNVNSNIHQIVFSSHTSFFPSPYRFPSLFSLLGIFEKLLMFSLPILVRYRISYRFVSVFIAFVLLSTSEPSDLVVKMYCHLQKHKKL